MYIVLLFILSMAAIAQRTTELTIAPKSASLTGTLVLEDLLGTKIKFEAPTSVTTYTLTWPTSVAAGCLTANGSGTLTWNSCVSLPIDDSSALIKGSADATKLIRFEVDGLTTATTRVLTVPDANFTLAGINISQFWTANQTYQANIYFDGLRDVGQAGAAASNIYGLQIRIPSGPCFLAGMNTGAGPSGLVWSQNSSCNTVAEMDGSGLELLNSGTLRVSGTTVLNGSRQLLNIAGVTSNLIPTSSATYSLGDSSGTGEWFQLYVRQIPAVELIWPKNSTSDVGYNGAGGYFRAGYFQNITISGTCTGCGSIGDATQFVRGAVNTTSQSFGGDKTFFGSVLPGSGSTYSNGSFSFPWFNVTARKIEIGNGFGSGSYFQLFSSNVLRLVDASGGVIQQWDSSIFPNQTLLSGHFLPSSGGSIGSSGLRWNTGYFTNLDMPSSGNLTAYVGSGNLYLRHFAGSPSCAGVANGWIGIDTFNSRIWVCIGGVAKWTLLN